MSIVMFVKKIIGNFLSINSNNDLLVVNDAGDELEL